MKLDKDFWDNRYVKNDTGWDLGGVATPIKEYIDQISNKQVKIIIPGCGNAHEAEYLFNNGFTNVFLIDLSPTALEQFKVRVPNFPKQHLICGNFFSYKGSFDLMIEQTFFCAINPDLRADYAKHAASLLKNKGKIIGLLFNDELNADHPPFGGSKEEYVNYFSPFFDINTIEPATNSVDPRSGRELFINFSKK